MLFFELLTGRSCFAGRSNSGRSADRDWQLGGSLKDVALWELDRIVTSEAIKRAGLNPGQIGHVVFRQVIQSEPRDAYISGIAAIAVGMALVIELGCSSMQQGSWCSAPYIWLLQ